jgi:anti-sigma regulatory factor (Ser/Thr protein kinase)
VEGYLEMRTGASLRAARVLNELIDVALRELDVDEATRHDVAMGVAELVANVHEHEYHGAKGDVLVRVDLQPDALRVTVESKGPKFDPTAQAVEAPDPELALEVGGLGFPLLHGLFDSVEHDYEEGRGNRITLTKRRSGVHPQG